MIVVSRILICYEKYNQIAYKGSKTTVRWPIKRDYSKYVKKIQEEIFKH